jgi:hypothetical protein
VFINPGPAIGNAIAAEPRADTSHPNAVDRPAFSFQFPGDFSPLAGTWQVDTGRADYDPDHKFLVETAKRRGFIMFSIADEEKDTKSLLETIVGTMTGEEYRDLKRTAFSQWGQYHGDGAVVSGKYRSGSHTGEVPFVSRSFVFLAARRTYALMEWIPDNDREAAAPGFRLVETTFQVKGADASTQEERAHERQAQQFYASEHWSQAAAEFEEAYKVRKDPAFLFNMALCYRRTGDSKRSADLYEDYLRKVPDSPRRTDIEGRIKALRQELADADRANKPPAENPAPESQGHFSPTPTSSVEPHPPISAQPDCPVCPVGTVCQSGQCVSAYSPSCPVGMVSHGEGSCVPAGAVQFANPIFGPDPEEAAVRARNRMRPKLSIDPEVVVGLMPRGGHEVVAPAGLLMVAYRQNYLPWFGLRLRAGPLLGVAAFSASDDSSCYGSQCDSSGGTTHTTRMLGGIVEAVPFFGPFGPVILGPVFWAAYLNFGSNSLDSDSVAEPLRSGATGGLGVQCGLLLGRREKTVLSFSVRGTMDSQTVFVAIGLAFQL